MYSLNTAGNRRLAVVAFAAGVCLTLASGAAWADDTADEVRAVIIERSEWSNKNLKDVPDTISAKGSLQFWSSGGLIQEVTNEDRLSTYEFSTIVPKHIQVITLVEGQAAVAMYYSEGGFKEKGGQPVPSYLTRATQVFVKENGKWKVAASHWSPITQGSGTNQNAVN